MTQPTLIGDTDYIGISEYAEHRYKADAEDMLMIKEIQHRSLSFGEGEGG